MNKMNSGITLLCAVLLTGVVFVSINCAGPGTMNGSFGTNISEQPMWGPIGYEYAGYYYFPDIDTYYSVSDHQYIYRDGSNWRHTDLLPVSYNGFDPYHSYKVVLNDKTPYQNNDNHRTRYDSFKGVRDQAVIRDSHDPKYFVNKDHPEHDNWVKTHQH
jgi:hypothetical protein